MGTLARAAVISGALVLLAGCATQYDPTNPLMRFAGGVEAAPIDGTTYRMTAKGNAFTSTERMQDFVMLKAAEISIERGFSHFLILAGESGYSQTGTYQAPGQYQSNTNFQANRLGNNVTGSAQTTGTYTPGYSAPIFKPGAQIFVKLLKKDDAKETGAFEAQAVYDAIAPRIKAR